MFSTDGGGSKSSNMGVIIGAAVGGVVLLLLLTLAGVYALRQRKRADRATDQNNPFGKRKKGLVQKIYPLRLKLLTASLLYVSAKWSTSKSSIDAPQLMGAKSFTFEELKKCTDNFSEANDVGGGGYGKVCVFSVALINGLYLKFLIPNLSDGETGLQRYSSLGATHCNQKSSTRIFARRVGIQN